MRNIAWARSRSAILVVTYLVVLCFSFVPGAKDARGAEWWIGGATGADYSNYSPMGTVSVEGGLWPEDKGWGFQSYIEFADPSCDDEMWTVGIEPVWRFKRKLYGGVGLAISDERLCDRAGTKWNFSIAVGIRITERLDIQLRHRSHGDDLGIREDLPNEGVNQIQLRWHK